MGLVLRQSLKFFSLLDFLSVIIPLLFPPGTSGDKGKFLEFSLIKPGMDFTSVLAVVLGLNFIAVTAYH